MIIKNSVRQLWRMKGRAGLFLLLLALASGLFSLGRGFQKINSRNMEAYEDSFMTIGTAEQKADAVTERREWDAGIKDYHIYNRSTYDEYVSLSALDFEGADYLSGPEKRVFYGAYNPEYKMYDQLVTGVLVEVSPEEDVVPDHPVQLAVTRVLYGEGMWEGMHITFCNHYDPDPEMLHAGKTYIMSLYSRPGHESEKKFPEDIISEFAPWEMLKSEQVGAEGEYLEDEVEPGTFYDEVTEGFYETDRGRRWMELLRSWEYAEHIFPVTGTNDIHLMMAFYNGDVWVSSGREFTEEEYAQGEKVCMLWENFARKNGLQVGDKIRLPFLYANHRYAAGGEFLSSGFRDTSLLNVEGEIYPVFEDSEYTITGLYGGSAGLSGQYGLAWNEILIPANSVKNSDEDNIVAYGPMLGSTTSFRIENGTIQEYLEKWSRQGIDNVEITFYDGGYTEMEAGIENMKHISRILVLMGLVMTLMVMGYFTWLFIIRQGERTAMERCLGLKKTKCFLSLFSGLFLLMSVGSVCGCAAGSVLSEQIAGNMEPAAYYDLSFSNHMAEAVEDTEEAAAEEGEDLMGEAAESVLGILLAGGLIAGMGICWNLRREPVELLAASGAEDS